MIPLVLGGLGAVGGGLGGAALAGRYLAPLSKAAYESADYLRAKTSSGLRKAAKGVKGVDYEGAGLGALGTPARALQARLEKAGRAVGNMPLGYVPGTAAATGLGLGGLMGATVGANVLGGIGQAMYPQQMGIDPESPYISQNPRGIGPTTL